MALLRRLIRWLRGEPEQISNPWLIDREGVVYKPERKVVLKAKSHA